MGRESSIARQERVLRLIQQLKKMYPEAHCSLTHANPWQLLVATILSAQCTDARVNMVTPKLFQEIPTPAAMAKTPLTKIEKLIQSTGFFRNKAKSLQGAGQAITEKHAGQVPATMEELIALPGVGRKTANVILGNAYGKNLGVVVDTHVSRLSQRMGLTKQTTPEKIEQDLMLLCPQEDWTLLSHLLIDHGRHLCMARGPKCTDCPLKSDCPAASE